jgi:hypothetical protein
LRSGSESGVSDLCRRLRGIDDRRAQASVGGFSVGVLRERSRHLLGVLAERVARAGLEPVLDGRIVGHETDHEVEQVPHVCLILGASAEERGLVMRPRRKRRDFSPADHPGEALQPTGWHWIGRVCDALSARPVHPAAEAIPVGVDRELASVLQQVTDRRLANP